MNISSRITGAWKAFVLNSDVSKGAYFWNSTSQQYQKNVGSNWRAYNKGVFSISTEIGGTTFFKYSDGSRHWP